ncbi:oxygen-insensitive NAD(P)H nitroreductase [Paracoccus sp. Z330]|uniref:Oxygen-insensitive NAD(P)H nitroreductase n=1 Tax=Paracoccus onchidii TaxID=3017813 RepID=A0ABT4Z9P3_9RHOB|nr:oxygen-insensitive NAD(P)H nitroreductase [Paracoccus onchidii]MDB6176065.1 oxygen-insensitive NAD(P)H nitroreductase [Paracoccus onchidii]
MTIHITDFAKSRHTAKAYSPRHISDEDMEKVRELLRYSPSSTNLQPWHFIIAESDAGKERVAKAAAEKFPFNAPAIRNASHVIVFASRIEADEDYLLKVLKEEERAGRFDGNPDFKPAMHQGRTMFLNIHQQQIGDGPQWMAHQVYLNLGQFLLGVAAMGIDATPMEGIDTTVLDEEFGLREQGYASLFVVPIGYADPEADYNKALPKSRLPESDIITTV